MANGKVFISSGIVYGNGALRNHGTNAAITGLKYLFRGIRLL